MAKQKTERNKKLNGKKLPRTYREIFQILDQLTDDYPEALDEKFPSDWTDPLELYGCYRRSLEARNLDLEGERAAICDLMETDRYTPSIVWHSRLNLVAQRILVNRN